MSSGLQEPIRLDLVRRFRRLTGDPRSWQAPLAARDQILLGAVGLQLVFSCWALGAVRLWAQAVMSVLAVGAFLLLFVPFAESRDDDVVSPTPRQNLRVLLRFPLFWCGLLLMAYIAIQGFNVAWEYHTDGNSWWLKHRDHVSWLPSGMDTPLDGNNPFRMLMILGAPWLVLCTAWVGLRRKRSARLVLWIAAVNGGIWTTFGILQFTTGTDLMFWRWDPPTSAFWASIMYLNHAGAYINLCLAIVLALFLYYYGRSRLRFIRSGSQLLILCLAVLIGGSQLLTLSRGAIVLCGALLLYFLFLVCILSLRRRDSARSPLPLALVLLLLAGLAYTLFHLIDDKRISWRFGKLEELVAEPDRSYRYHLNLNTWEMLKERWWWGWGAGAFRYYFPVYQRGNPVLDRKVGGRQLFFSHAHNDLLQLPTELGVAGSSAIVIGLLYWPWLAWRRWRQVSLAVMMLWGASALTILHASFDTIFHCPAVLVLFFVLLVAGGRLLSGEPDHIDYERLSS